MTIPFGPILGAVGSIVGGLFADDAAEEARDQQQEQFERNIALQREFAQNGIRWKVDDARAAGLHPLAAIGMQGASYSPVSTSIDRGSSMDLAGIGQNIGRAIDATRTKEESEEEREMRLIESKKANLEVEHMMLRNDFLRSQIAQVNQVQSNPGMPSGGSNPWLLPGQSNGPANPRIKEKPMERTMVDPAKPASEPGAHPDVGYSKTVNGGWAPVMSNDVKQRLEEDWPGMIWWNLRNRVLGGDPPDTPLPKHHQWEWKWISGEWKQVPTRYSIPIPPR
ncbi:MAG: DNA pilot protein [Arizlama microvirus]|nr:MAG: DNA pilot protein [Arizlama microvirus]